MQQKLPLLLAALAAVGSLFVAATAQACAPTVNLGDTSVTFPASISVPANTPVGTVIASTTMPVAGTNGTTYDDNCGLGGNIYWQITAGAVVPNRIASTSVPGIGYTSSLSGGGFNGSVGMDSKISGTSLPSKGGGKNYFTSQVFVTVNLVVTGPVSSGLLRLNPTGPGIPGIVGYYFNGDSGLFSFRVVSPDNMSSVVAVGCTVNTPSPTVNLPKVSTGSLPTNGSTAGDTPFALGLNCAAGVKVNLTLTDVSNPSNTSNVLGLASGSSATGVGLQILNGGTPVFYGIDSPNAGNTNQWFAGTATGGAMNIPLSVRYVRTPDTLVPGLVKGLATFTMSYQ